MGGRCHGLGRWGLLSNGWLRLIDGSGSEIDRNADEREQQNIGNQRARPYPALGFARHGSAFLRFGDAPAEYGSTTG